MINNQFLCDPHRIELFLQQKLTDDEQSAFELHLDDCHDCRRQLETSAAAEDAWSAVRESLRDPPMLPSPSGRGVGGEGEPENDSALDSAAGEDVSSSQATILKLLAPTDDDRMIGRWGTYEVVGVVGTGGMGVVLKAFDVALNRYVAIKILAPHLGTSGAAIRRFSREGKAAAAVVHDNVIEIYGVSEAAGLPYLVMPYVRGPSLQRRLNDEGPLAIVEILRVAMQAAAGLAAAHAQGLVHRDVKPANILLADGIERVKLTDFGLARAADDASLTRTGVIAGTPQYMSPEQARGEPVDPRSDLFSLGSVLYAMSTGRPPFRAETSYGVLRRITDEEPRPIREINPDIPDWLCAIVSKLMAKHPDDRFQSAQEVAALLEQCLAHVQQPTAVPLPNVLLTLRREEVITTERDEYDSANPNPTRKRGTFRASLAYASGYDKHPRLLKGTLTMFTLLGLSLFAAGVVSTTPPDMSGNWQGDDWGQVTLTQTAPGEYTGTYIDTVVKEKGPGKIDLKWSRIERRYIGTWREGEDDRFGDLSIRLIDKEIRGALTTDPNSKINPGTPRLADLVWARVNSTKRVEDAPAFGPIVERVLTLDRSKSTSYLKLDNGEYIAPLLGGAEVSNEQVQRKGVNLFVSGIENETNSRTVRDVIMGEVSDTVWDDSAKWTPQEARTNLVRSLSDRQPVTGRVIGAPCTFAFTTREGNFGLFRLVRQTKSPSGILVQIKLLREPGHLQPWPWPKTNEREIMSGTVSDSPHHRAIQFDGNHYAKVEPPPKFTAGDFTISLGLNPVRSETTAYPFMRGLGYRDQRGDIGLMLHRDSGELAFDVNTGGNSCWLFGWDRGDSPLRSPVRYGQWNHVVVNTRRGRTLTPCG